MNLNLLKNISAFLDVASDTEVELDAEDDDDTEDDSGTEVELDGVQLRYFETEVISPVGWMKSAEYQCGFDHLQRMENYQPVKVKT